MENHLPNLPGCTWAFIRDCKSSSPLLSWVNIRPFQPLLHRKTVPDDSAQQTRLKRHIPESPQSWRSLLPPEPDHVYSRQIPDHTGSRRALSGTAQELPYSEAHALPDNCCRSCLRRIVLITASTSSPAENEDQEQFVSGAILRFVPRFLLCQNSLQFHDSLDG